MAKSSGSATTATISSAIYDAAAKTITFTIADGDIDSASKLNVRNSFVDSNGKAVPGSVSTCN